MLDLFHDQIKITFLLLLKDLPALIVVINVELVLLVVEVLVVELEVALLVKVMLAVVVVDVEKT